MAVDYYKLGQMLGNIYSNIWTANADRRDDKKIEGIKQQLNGGPELQTADIQNAIQDGMPDSNASINDVQQALGDNAVVGFGPEGVVINKKATPQSAMPQSVKQMVPADVKAQDGIVGVEPTKNTGLSWQPKFSAMDLDRAMRERGIGRASRDRAIVNYNKELADQAQKEMLPDIVNALGEGRTRDAFKAMLQYRKYDPDTANMLMKDYQNAIQFNRQKELQDIALANKLALQNNATQNKIQYRTTVGGGGGGKTKTAKSEKMMNARDLTKQISNLQAEIDNLPSGSPEFMQKSATRDKLTGELDALQNYGIEGQREYNDDYKAERERIASTDYNLNNWDDAAELANEMIYREGVPPKETIARLKAAGAPNWVISGLEGSYKDIL